MPHISILRCGFPPSHQIQSQRNNESDPVVTSTEAAHAFVSRAVKKSAPLPRTPLGQRRAPRSPSFFLLPSRRDLLLRLSSFGQPQQTRVPHPSRIATGRMLLFLLPFSAQKSRVKPPGPVQPRKSQQRRTFRALIHLANFPVEPRIIEIGRKSARRRWRQVTPEVQTQPT